MQIQNLFNINCNFSFSVTDYYIKGWTRNRISSMAGQPDLNWKLLSYHKKKNSSSKANDYSRTENVWYCGINGDYIKNLYQQMLRC